MPTIVHKENLLPVHRRAVLWPHPATGSIVLPPIEAR